MCTFHFSLNDAEVNRIRPAFKDDAAIEAWMLKQLETAIMLFEVPQPKKVESVHLSDDVAWFKNHPVKLTSEDMDERTKYILGR